MIINKVTIPVPYIGQKGGIFPGITSLSLNIKEYIISPTHPIIDEDKKILK
jgi:hypothetical protein